MKEKITSSLVLRSAPNPQLFKGLEFKKRKRVSYKLLKLKTVKVVKGHFSWCGKPYNDSIRNNVRVPSCCTEESRNRKFLYLETEKHPLQYAHVRKNKDGHGFKYQYSVNGKMLFDISQDNAPLKPVSFSHKDKFYVFSADLTERSPPISFTKLPLHRHPSRMNSDIDLCELCHEPVVGEDPELEILTCGHWFHNECLLKKIEKFEHHCTNCAYFDGKGMSHITGELTSTHIYTCFCPVCQTNKDVY